MELDKIAPALVAAQKNLPKIGVDSENPHFRNKFASLPKVVEAVKATLNLQKIAVLQFPVSDEAGVGVRTLLVHESGQVIDAGAFTLPLSKRDPQGGGSALTYARRYALCAVVGMAPDKDDDANEASAEDEPETWTEVITGVKQSDDEFEVWWLQSKTNQVYKATDPQAAIAVTARSNGVPVCITGRLQKVGKRNVRVIETIEEVVV